MRFSRAGLHPAYRIVTIPMVKVHPAYRIVAFLMVKVHPAYRIVTFLVVKMHPAYSPNRPWAASRGLWSASGEQLLL
jgi:hypothetical protein